MTKGSPRIYHAREKKKMKNFNEVENSCTKNYEQKRAKGQRLERSIVVAIRNVQPKTVSD